MRAVCICNDGTRRWINRGIKDETVGSQDSVEDGREYMKQSLAGGARAWYDRHKNARCSIQDRLDNTLDGASRLARIRLYAVHAGP